MSSVIIKVVTKILFVLLQIYLDNTVTDMIALHALLCIPVST